MTFETFFEMARSMNEMGDAVLEQLDAVLDDEDSMDEQNPNALRMIAAWLKDHADEADDLQSAEMRTLAVSIEKHLSAKEEE